MKLSLLLTGAIGLFAFEATGQSNQGYIVILNSYDNPGEKGRSIAKEHGVELGHIYNHAFKGFSFRGSEQAAENIRNLKDVQLIEKDGKVSINAPKEGKGKPDRGETTPPPPQETPWGISRVGGIYNCSYDCLSKTAWVIDSGIDLDHEDLNVDATRGFSAFTKGKDAGYDDGNGHGTHVAGTIAAIDNSVGVVGVAAGATVVPVKVLNSRGSGSYSGVIAGIDHVAANGQPGDVANMSLGGGVSSAVDLAVINAAAKGIFFTLAAGNESDDADNHSPARAEGANIYTVSAFDINDTFAYFSNYGTHVDVSAPGVAILSTWKNGEYNTISGTSMAAPHMAGILLKDGTFLNDGVVLNDPDNNPDPIAVLP